MFALGAFTNSNNNPEFIVKLALSPTTPTNLNNIHAPSIIIYPNPVFEILKINNKEQANQLNITIYDITGKVVFETVFCQKIENSVTEVNIEKLTPGLYLIKVSSELGTISQKFLKEK
jgi:hypothetical protein